MCATKFLDTVLVAHENIWFTINNGSQWTKINILQNSFPVNLMSMSPSNTKVVYYENFGLYRALINYSTGTATVTNIGNVFLSIPAQISSINIHPNNDSIVWVTLSGTAIGEKVYKAIDAGVNWINISGNIPNVPASSLSYSSINNGLYIGTDAGVYYKDDLNPVWVSYNTGLPNAIITKIIADDNNNKVKVSTYGRGIWQSDSYSGNTVGVYQKQIVNNQVRVYPNPTSSIINIETELHILNIDIINVLGQRVESVVTDNINTREPLKTKKVNLSHFI
jgi:xyloglucan-specific exo-beta-1,4-glucanase